MQQHKHKEAPLLSNKPKQPEFEEIKLEPVDDLLAQLTAAKDPVQQAVPRMRELYDELTLSYITLRDGTRVPVHPDRMFGKCRSGCACDPCRIGACGSCEVDNYFRNGDLAMAERARLMYRGW